MDTYVERRAPLATLMEDWSKLLGDIWKGEEGGEGSDARSRVGGFNGSRF